MDVIVQVQLKAKEKRWVLRYVLNDIIEGADLTWGGNL